MKDSQKLSSMASLVAYEDSDSEAEAEPAGSFNPAGQMEDASAAAPSHRWALASDSLDVADAGAQPAKREDPAGRRLPLVRLWRNDPGSRPSQRLLWPRPEPEVTAPPSQPPRPSLWTSQTPAGHVPLAAARLQQPKPPWGAYDSPEASFHARTESERPGSNGSSLQRKRCEDSVVPYTPKRLRHLQALSAEAGKGEDAEAQGPSGRRPPAPLCVGPQVSEFIQPYLDGQHKETTIPKKVLFHLRGHRGPVNSVQWCPVFAKSHMLLSTSMDKTFKVKALRASVLFSCSWECTPGMFYLKQRGRAWSQAEGFFLEGSVVLFAAFGSGFHSPFGPLPASAVSPRPAEDASPDTPERWEGEAVE